MDYRELLKRYIAYVICQESVSFLEYVSEFGEGPLSAEDVAELKRLDAEVENEKLWDRRADA